MWRGRSSRRAHGTPDELVGCARCFLEYTRYIDHAVQQLAADGLAVTDGLLAGVSPLQFEHINFHGRYTFAPPQLNGTLRPLRDPNASDDEDELAA